MFIPSIDLSAELPPIYFVPYLLLESSYNLASLNVFNSGPQPENPHSSISTFPAPWQVHGD